MASITYNLRTIFVLLALGTHLFLALGHTLETQENYDLALAELRESFEQEMTLGQIVKVQNANKGQLTCGNYSTASKRDVMTMLFDLREKHHFDKCGAPAKTCLRQSCDNTSGLYLCNDNDHEIQMGCWEMCRWFSDVGGCCPKDWVQSKAISGVLPSDEGWRVIIAYANCNHPADRDDPAIFLPPYQNGDCQN